MAANTPVSRPEEARSRSMVSFWLHAGVLALLMFAASAPSPLYPLYAAQWRLTSATITEVFALYALTLLAALLVAGRLSDHVGRRPVIVAALAVEAAAMVCFLGARSAALLYLARFLQGLATGAAIGALSAALVELSAGRPTTVAPLVNSAAPTAGLAVGALGASALVQFGPSPSHLVYWILLACCVVAAAAVAALPEPGVRRAGALASLVPRIGIPPRARATFTGALPCLVALWGLGGFYLSLGPSLAGQLTGSADLLWGGLVIFLLTGVGAAASIAGRNYPSRPAMLQGCAALVAGVALTFAAITSGSAALLLAGTCVAGAGFGLAFLGAFRAIMSLAEPAERAGLVASVYVVSYLAFGVPAVVAGLAATHIGLHRTALVYAASVGVLAAAGAASLLIRRPVPDAAATSAPHTASPTAGGVCDLPPCPGTVPLCLHASAITATAPAMEATTP